MKMCGICGFVGDGNIKDILLQDLKKLEYRGYDSSGIAVRQDDKIVTYKSVGEISNLEKQIKDKRLDSLCGIAHTRWATHGKATIENCHPHLSNNGKWAIVHNGIIENYLPLKNKLLAKGYKFVSETDTEVIANMIEDSKATSPIRTIISATKRLKGSFALAIINADRDVIYLAKRTSPLYVAKVDGGYKVSSDMATFFGVAKKCYILDDDEYAMVMATSVKFFNVKGEQISLPEVEVSDNVLDSTVKKEKHFMLKEIKEIPFALSSTYMHLQNSIDEDKVRKIFKGAKRVCLIGCGTAYHACVVGANYLERLCGIHSDATVASEFRYSGKKVNKSTIYIFVSQSGETADTIACAKYVKEGGAKTIAITNVPHSTINKVVDMIIPTTAGKEIAVASTKAYNCQCLVFYILACILKKERYDTKCKKLIEEYKTPHFDQDDTQCVLESDKVFFVGRDWDFVSCMEASLKLKEITYINSVAMEGGELKHGTLALIDENTLVIVICTRTHIADKMANCIHEIRSRKGKVWLFTTLDPVIFGEVEKITKLHSYRYELDPVTTIVPLQQLAYYTSVKKGINPDKPRNLAKSVTVE